MSCKAPGRQQRCPGASTAVSACALQAHRAALLRLEPAGAQARQGPSLAQRLGLAPAPPGPLSPAEWLERQQASQRRQDSAGACPICLRAFKAEAQVLLSCSHTFHAACLASFERFSRQTAGAAERACPLCRCASYEKRRIHDAALLWRHICATRIQAAWRGVLGRRQARALRRLLPPTHPAVLRRWAAEELGECCKGLLVSVDQGAAEVEALFSELDATSRACQGVYAALAARCPAAADTAAAGVPRAAAGGGAGAASGQPPDQQSSPASISRGAAGSAAPLVHSTAANRDSSLAAPDWEAAIDRFLQREAPECPICLCSLAVAAPQESMPRSGAPAPGGAPKIAAPGASRGPSGRAQGSHPAPQAAASSGRSSRSAGGGSSSGGGVAVLSCSHAFHSDCLSAFEAFALASELAPACPCCRAAYQRMDLH